MRIMSFRIGLCALLALTAVEHATLAEREGAPALAAGNAIFAKVADANARREAALQSYSSTREYTVAEPGHEPDADLVISMRFVAPATKTFSAPSEQGVSWIHRRVFDGLMNAEREAAEGPQKTESALTPANYDAELVGDDRYLDRDCYVLALRPKRQNKYVLTGKVWIDKEDFAIAKIEGDPVKSPSFWIRNPHLIRQYQRVGGFWLPLQDDTRCHVRLVGDYALRIRYYDYQVDPNESGGPAKEDP